MPDSLRPKCQNSKCRKVIPATKRSNARYCSGRCQKTVNERNRRRRRRAEAGQAPAAIERLNAQEEWRRENLIKELIRTGLHIKIREGALSLREVARALDVPSAAQVQRAMAEIELRELVSVAADKWERSDETTRLLALDIEQPHLLDIVACWEWAEHATEAFLQWEAHYMALPNGDPWIREDFHKLWIKEILFAIATGGYLQILSPPRHGKTELLTHFVVWLIVRNPNIRIIWMGPNEQKSKEVTAKIKEILEKHEQLITDTLPPDQTYAPKSRQGGVWQAATFKVDCRQTGIAGNTFLGIGRGAKILSLNADVLVGDDLEDHESTKNATVRKETRSWWITQFDSRKEEHTAMFLIGSRQHIEDFYSYNIVNPNFRVVINTAHDPECLIPEQEVARHVDCVLFPALRSFRWLMTKKTGSDTMAEADETGTYEMVYQNDPAEDDSYIFSDALLSPSFNPARSIGLRGIPETGRRLIGGMDPSATGRQAALLWALTPVDDIKYSNYLDTADTRYKRWMVDIDNRLGGGIEAAIELWNEWLILYGVRHWVLEDNAFQAMFLDDPRTRAWCHRNDVHVEGVSTYENKTDPIFGVSAMKRLWVPNPQGIILVDLPYMDEASIAKTTLYVRQLKAHSDEKKVKGKTDVKMAGWFPTKRIRKWEKELAAERVKANIANNDVYPRSYAKVTGFSTSGTPPWSR
jgi:hypothetical protein